MLQTATGLATDDWDEIRDALVDMLCATLAQSPNQQTLQAMATHQARLDPVGLEGIAAAWAACTGCTLADCGAPREPTTQERTLLAQITLQEWSQTAALRELPHPANLADLRRVVVAYMLSATLKDASFFIGLNPTATLHWIDLDPKPIAKLPYYMRQDHQITTSFAAWLAKWRTAEMPL